MTDEQIKKLNELTEMSQKLGLYEDRPDWRIILQADHIKRLEEQLKAKEQAEEKLVKQIQTICDFINNRPETFKGINGSVDKIITDYAERKEQECEELKLDLIEAKAHGDYLNNLALSETLNLVSEQLDQLKAELKSAKELREYTYDCCKRAGEELAKNSFDWDGKEKNLVVQAMELNERYDQLKEQLEAYKMEAEEGIEINAELKAENDKLKTYITSFDYLDSLSNEQVAVLYTACIDELAIRGYEAKYKTEASLLTRYHNALTEIKEYLKPYLFRGGVEPQWVEWQMAQREKEKMAMNILQILQKISECEVEDD